MRRTFTTTVAAACLAVGLTACASTAKTSSADAASGTPAGSASTGAPVAQALDATGALAVIAKAVPSAKLSMTFTAANDPNSLLGRPGEYTSKVSFADSRVPASDTSGLQAGDVQLGGSIEVFASAADAATRAKYVEAVTKAMAAFAEYDYVHGTVLVRVSHFLTPGEAQAYDTATASLG